MRKRARTSCRMMTGGFVLMAVFSSLNFLAQGRPGVDCGHGMLTAIGPAGPVVVAVGEGSPAEVAGIRAGDVILGVDGAAARNGVELAVQVNPDTQKRKCGDNMGFQIQSGGSAHSVKVTLAPYENPLTRTPFILRGVQETAADSLFAPILPEEWAALKAEAARMKKPSGPIEIGSEYQPSAVSPGGGVSLAPSDGHTSASLYTPRLALVDHLIRQRIAGQASPSEDLLHAYAQANAFCVTARPASLVARVVLLRGERAIPPSAVSEGFPFRFWFPLDTVRSGELFSVAVTDTNGSTTVFKVTPKRLQKLGIR